VEVPKLRIVSEELWSAVQAQINHVKGKLGASRLGGMNRTTGSRSYLFSGLLVCGDCSSRLVIVSGRGKRGYVKYGCPSHRYRGVCHNAVTIRQDRLEEQLLGALERRIADPQTMEYILARFQEAFQKRRAEFQRQAIGLDGLRRERGDLQTQAQHLTDAIAAAGHSPALLSKLGDVEARTAEVDRRLEACKPNDFTATAGEIRNFVYRNLMHLQGLFQNADASTAKMAFSRHIGQLVLKPHQTASGPVYEVSGGVELLAGKEVMVVVARDGIEPPTPAFSGLRSLRSI
jgi:site-specific DNA recombinase